MPLARTAFGVMDEDVLKELWNSSELRDLRKACERPKAVGADRSYRCVLAVVAILALTGCQTAPYETVWGSLGLTGTCMTLDEPERC